MCIGFGVCQMPVRSLWPLTSTKSLIKHCLNCGLCITLVPYNWLLIHHGMLGLVGVIYQSEVILTLNLTFDPMIVKPHLILVLRIAFVLQNWQNFVNASNWPWLWPFISEFTVKDTRLYCWTSIILSDWPIRMISNHVLIKLWGLIR